MYRLTWAVMMAAKRPWSLLRFCCVALLTLAAGLSLILLPAIRRTEPPPDYNKGEPDFAACDFPAPCGPPGMRSFYKVDLLRRVAQAATSLVEGGRTPLILQIGTYDLSSTDVFTDLDLWLRVLMLFPRAVRDAVRMVFVEPNALVFSELRKNIQNLGLGPNQSHVVNAMILDVCPSESIPMYHFNAQAELDFGVSHFIYSSWFGRTPDHPLGALRGFSMHTALDLAEKRNWLAFAAAANQSKYVREVKVPCKSPSSLMTTIGAPVADMVMLVVDAEEADFSIVDRFLDLPGFAPEYLQYECTDWKLLSHLEVLYKERKSGFAVGSTYGHGRNNADADNAVAIRKQP